ncbi:unnamed protein product [Cylicocyclus nassatus]|uniref:Uncharacterized protein n=1 Tax=Cylicocyclus nassatus TaxID=53992 RepID=A0AA36GT09_CYLNA|nr:unnamed protein product [Cylicocyclus nassatus]
MDMGKIDEQIKVRELQEAINISTTAVEKALRNLGNETEQPTNIEHVNEEREGTAKNGEIMKEPAREEPERDELLVTEEARLHKKELLVPVVLELELDKNQQAAADLNLVIEELENQKSC